MGFINASSELTLTAKLTPFGRKELLTKSGSIITKFILGDSDANYYNEGELPSGQVPSIAGNLGKSNQNSNSSANNTTIINKISQKTTSEYKPVDIYSSEVYMEVIKNSNRTVTNGVLTQATLDRTDYTTTTYGNLFRTFGLPVTETEKTNFTGTTSVTGGFADTALSGLNEDQVVMISIPTSNYGEQIDGKSLKVTVEISTGTLDLYGTYENTGLANSTHDGNLSDLSNNAKYFGDNVVFLFSDDIKRPQGDVSRSWSTGYGTTKPYALNSKELYELSTKTDISGDTVVGIALLDKGLIAITEPTIVSDFVSTGSTMTFDDYYTEVSQTVNVMANRGEFIDSKNPTYSSGDVIRISEVGLYDDSNNLIAIAKPDRHILKRTNEIFASSIKIVM